LYTKDHEWIKLDKATKIGTVGISKHAAETLGDVVYVELPAKGAKLKVKNIFRVCDNFLCIFFKWCYCADNCSPLS
jgi:glycine cleavage system H protein